MLDQTSTAGDFIHRIMPQNIPADAMHMARRCLVDTLAIWAAGSATEPGRIVSNHAARRYSGNIPLPFDGRLTNPVGFAFAGAASIDAVDGHDGHQLCKGHASVALVPALFAELASLQETTMDEALSHLVVGEEVAIRAGLALHASVPDYHSSGAWNGLGAAAIAARLRRFDANQTAHALGIAEYYGPRAQMMRCIDYPTMVKDSSSWGALVGVSAADLAEDGFTGAPAITCEQDETRDLWLDLEHRWRILETNFKAYPVCRWAHPAIEAVLHLLRTHDISADQIAKIVINTFHEATRLDTRRPVDGDAAQYSLPLVVAAALHYGDVLPHHVVPEGYDNQNIWRLVDAIQFTEEPRYKAVFPRERIADVTIVLANGEEFKSPEMQARGNFDTPLSDQEILNKLHNYSNGQLSGEAQDRIASILLSPSDAPTPAELMRLLGPRN